MSELSCAEKLTEYPRKCKQRVGLKGHVGHDELTDKMAIFPDKD